MNDENNVLYLYTPHGMGDILICYGFIKEFSKKYNKIYYYVVDPHFDNTIRLFRSIPNVEITKCIIINNLVQVHKNTLIVGWQHYTKALENNPDLHCDKFCYEYVNVPLEKKWDNFYFERDIEKEKNVFYNILGLKDEEEFFFVHEAEDKGFLDRGYIKENVKIINPTHYPQVSLFDFLYTIEKSKEVHVVNSSFLTLIDIININHDNLYYHRYVKSLYPRDAEFSQPTLKLNWKIIKPMNKIEILKNLTVYNPVNKKIRLGRCSDGGYVIIDGYDYDYFISAGVGGVNGIEENISFEIDFFNKYPFLKGLIFDGTIPGDPQNLPEQLKFIKKNIDSMSTNNTTNLKEYIKDYNDIFIKMDIDGCEWDWMLNFSDSFSKVKQLVIEIHGIFNNSTYPKANNYKILRSLLILNTTHYLVHAHANNCCEYITCLNGVTHDGYPNVLELTFIRKDCQINGLNTLNLPIQDIDFPNCIMRNEINMSMWPFMTKY